MSIPDPASAALAQSLLGDVPLAHFLSDHYTQRALFLEERFQPETLLTLDELENLLDAREAFETVDVMSRAPGEPATEPVRSLGQLYDRIEAGDSVHIAQVDRLMPGNHPLIALLRAFSVAMQAPVRGITLFIAPPGKSIPCHHDIYEAVTLQLSGRKRWELFRAASPETTTEAPSQSETPVDVVTLSPGDALYVPKGQFHRVEGVDGISFSLAMVYEPPSWLALVDLLLEELVRDPLFWGSISGPVAEAAEQRKAALVDAVKRIDSTDFAMRIERALGARVGGVPVRHLREVIESRETTPATQVRQAPGQGRS